MFNILLIIAGILEYVLLGIDFKVTLQWHLYLHVLTETSRL